MPNWNIPWNQFQSWSFHPFSTIVEEDRRNVANYLTDVKINKIFFVRSSQLEYFEYSMLPHWSIFALLTCTMRTFPFKSIAIFNCAIMKLSCSVNFIEAPQPPVDCSVHNESTALEVNCIPGSDGGLPQHFLLEVRTAQEGRELFQTSQTLQTPQSDQGAAGEAPPIYQERNPSPSFHLHDLEPGFDYTVAVYAVNGRGRSEPALLRNVRVSESVGRTLERSGGFVLKDLRSVIPQANSENMIMILSVIGKCNI